MASSKKLTKRSYFLLENYGSSKVFPTQFQQLSLTVNLLF